MKLKRRTRNRNGASRRNSTSEFSDSSRGIAAMTESKNQITVTIK